VRTDRPVTPELKRAFKTLTADAFQWVTLGGEPVVERLTHAPGNGAAIGGIKLVMASGWMAVRPSGTEDIYKVYAESFRSQEHLQRLVEDGQAVVAKVLGGG
jgi:phosphoglucomutase